MTENRSEKFADFFKDNLQPATRYAIRLCGDVQLGMDLTQEAMIRMGRCADAGREYNRSILFTGIRNLFRTELAQAKKREQAYKELAAEIRGKSDTKEPDYQWVRDALEKLTPREREIIELTCDGLKPAAIADGLGISAASVSNRLLEARKKLRQMLRGGPKGEEEGDDDAV